MVSGSWGRAGARSPGGQQGEARAIQVLPGEVRRSGTSASSTTYHLGSTPEETAPFRASPEMAVAPAWRHTDGGLGGKEADYCKGLCGLVMQEECKALPWGNG